MAAIASSTTSKYVHVREIASGGMGRVDLALRSEGRFQRLYAVKRLQPQYLDDPAFQHMFTEEAQLAGLLHHPNVVPVLDVGEDSDGPFLVMEYIDGVSLAALLTRFSKTGESIPLAVVLTIGVQTARGLHAAHELTLPDGSAGGMIHRDVSPQNVLLGYDGMVRVTDFGIAKVLGQETHTTTGVLKGKLGYMSPEQLQFHKPDRRSDLFALGVVLYEMLAGGRLYGGGMTGARKILHEPVPDVGEVRLDAPPSLVELSLELLAKSPDHRPSTAAKVASRLEAMLHDVTAVDGPVDLGAFIGEAFAEQRRAWQREVSERLRVLRESPPSRRDAVEPVEAASVEVAAVTPVPARRGRWLVLGAVALAVAAVATAWTFAGSEPEEQSPAVSSTPAEPAEPVSAQPVRVVPAASDLEAAAGGEAQAEPERLVEEPSESNNRRGRRRSRRRAQPMESNTMNAPMDGRPRVPGLNWN